MFKIIAALTALSPPASSTPPGTSDPAPSDVIIVDPKVMANDWVSAFHSLQSKNLPNITFTLRGNKTVTNIVSIEPLSGGYLLLFHVRTVQGPRYQIIKTSDILSLATP